MSRHVDMRAITAAAAALPRGSTVDQDQIASDAVATAMTALAVRGDPPITDADVGRRTPATEVRALRDHLHREKQARKKLERRGF